MTQNISFIKGSDKGDLYLRNNFSLPWFITIYAWCCRTDCEVLSGRLRSINSQQLSRSELIFASTQQHHALISNKSWWRNIILILIWYRKEIQHYWNVFQRTILQWTSTEVNVYMQHHQTRSFACITCTLVTWIWYIGNVNLVSQIFTR